MRLARVLGYRDQPGADCSRTVRGRAPRPPHRGPRHPRAALLRPVARDPRGHRPALARGRRRAARRLRLHRRRTHPGGRPRARRRPDPPLARDPRAPPGDPRLALRDARPRPRAAPAPAPDRGPGPLRRRSRSRSATIPVQPSAPATCSASSRVVGDALRAIPSSSTRSTTTRPSAVEATRAELVADALDTLEWRGDQEQRREGLRRFKRRELLRIATRDLLGFAPPRGDRTRAHRPGRGVPGGGAGGLAPAVAVRRHRHGPPRWRRALVRVRHRRAVRVRRRQRRRLQPRRARRRAARAGDRSDDRGGTDLPHRRAAAAGRQPGAAGALDRRLPPVLRAVGSHLGAPGADQGAVRRRRCRARARFAELADRLHRTAAR